MPDSLLNPILLYVACGLGALGVFVALPKRSPSPFIIGAVIAATGLGALLVALGLKAGPEALPNIHFYIFGGLALVSALRVITHPRPVYAALWFVMAILSSSGLYVILSAEFMAFALIIVYAGAILITYLFVIMLATEAPSEEEPEALQGYDRLARDPLVAVLAGFLLLAALTGMFGKGADSLAPNAERRADHVAKLMLMPRTVESILRQSTAPDGRPLIASGEKIARDAGGMPRMNLDPVRGQITIAQPAGGDRVVLASDFPRSLKLDNTQALAHTFIGGHPGSIEIAGVILLMAMVGAVVLARKKVEIDDAAKALAARDSLAGGAM